MCEHECDTQVCEVSSTPSDEGSGQRERVDRELVDSTYALAGRWAFEEFGGCEATPGPWVHRGDEEPPRYVVESEDGQRVCMLSWQGPAGGLPAVAANGRLIAAAPALLRALSAVIYVNEVDVAVAPWAAMMAEARRVVRLALRGAEAVEEEDDEDGEDGADV